MATSGCASEMVVHGSGNITHYVNGEKVLEYSQPQYRRRRGRQLRHHHQDRRQAHRRRLHLPAERVASHRLPQGGVAESRGLHGSQRAQLQELLREVRARRTASSPKARSPRCAARASTPSCRIHCRRKACRKAGSKARSSSRARSSPAPCAATGSTCPRSTTTRSRCPPTCWCSRTVSAPPIRTDRCACRRSWRTSSRRSRCR